MADETTNTYFAVALVVSEGGTHVHTFDGGSVSSVLRSVALVFDDITSVDDVNITITEITSKTEHGWAFDQVAERNG